MQVLLHILNLKQKAIFMEKKSCSQCKISIIIAANTKLKSFDMGFE